MKLNPILKDFWSQPAQIKVLYGGRMSGKTYDTAGIISFLASKYKVRVACLRRFQNKLSESVFTNLKTVINSDDRLKPCFNITENTMRGVNGSDFIFMGIQRNIEEIKGLDDIDITWIEEAEKITKEQWDLIRPTVLRKENSFCILVFNPYLDTDFVYSNFVKKNSKNILKRFINYNDNPFLSESAKSLIENDKLELSDDDFKHIYLGMPKQDDEDALIKRSLLYECVDAHSKLGLDVSGAYRIGYDVADSGDDKNCIVSSHGCLVYSVCEWQAKENELFESTQKVVTEAYKNKSHVIFDCIGVGASVGSNINQINNNSNIYITHEKFNSGSSVDDPDTLYKDRITNKDMFSNLKAQVWWDIADRVKYTYNAIHGKIENIEYDKIISISSDIDCLDDLIIELSTPKKSIDKAGKVKVESKDDLKKRGFKSPNKADAFIMSLYQQKTIDYSKLMG